MQFPKNQKVSIVAEIGCNHMGDLSLAKRMIADLSKVSGLSYVKFQKRNVAELLSPAQYNAPHPCVENSFGKTYGEHREFLEFSIEQHRQLKEECKSFGIGYACSVWDLTSADEINSLNPDYIKIPSACNLNFPLISHVFKIFKGPVHISLGMISHKEIDQLAQYLKRLKFLDRTIFYACVSGYPVETKNLSLLELKYLHNNYGDTIKAIGFSGHHTTTFPDIAAVALGAQWIERHFTTNRNLKGTDHKASLVKNELQKLTLEVKKTVQALTMKDQEILSTEFKIRKKLSNEIPPQDNFR